MSFATLPNELVLEIAIHLPVRELTTNCDLTRSIALDRPASLRSILCSPTLNINGNNSVPNSNTAWPLHYAAQYSSPEIVAILIGHGLPVDEPELTLATTLQCAVLGRSPAIVALILDAGANIDRISDRNTFTPLVLACQNIVDDISGLALVIIASTARNALLNRMLDTGAPVDTLHDSTLTDEPVTPLQFLCMFYQIGVCPMVEVFLRRGADVNRGREGTGDRFPLCCATRSGNADLARILIDFGADRDVMFGGKTLAVIAREIGMVDVLDVLVGYGM
ncbi:hypothetical protein Q9L58_002278 [Maublancomyces gigas]|uniref:Ankyrin n=1 Tax=Discina gigas TaxID=1032678 RepID=A0ABR3GS27_9PEZI